MPSPPSSPARIVLVLRDDLPGWRAVNAAAVLSLTLGARLAAGAALLGPPITTADGVDLGAISRPAMPVLTVIAQALDALHAAARAHPQAVVVALDEAMFTANAYDAYARAIQERVAAAFACFALILAGSTRAIRTLTGGLPLYTGAPPASG